MEEKLLQIARVEKKYLLSELESIKMQQMLRQALPEDLNNKENGYMVRSLYFDTLYNTDYYDKEDGLYQRKKIRLRIYSTGSMTAKLERKEKFGENQYKNSLTIKKEEALQMIAGDYAFLLAYREPFAKEMYFAMQEELYRPKCIVQYNRKAFVVQDNDTRITFDSQIQATETDLNLFSEHLNLLPVCSPNEVTMEVKYNRFLLSYVKNMIAACDKQQLSRSKYILGRSLSLFDIDNYI